VIEIIADIHGHANELKSRLSALGYLEHGGGYRHSYRRVVFVGGFVDRPPAIGEIVLIARAMVDAGDALMVKGNHEYKAIAFRTARPSMQSEWFRHHSDKNSNHYQATLKQLSLSLGSDQ